MAIPFESRILGRKNAPFHVQLELEKSAGVQIVSGTARVSGRAVRVFRTDGRLTAGDPVAFGLWVCEPGDEPTGPAYVYFDELTRTSYMEAYLEGTPPEFELVAYEYKVIDSPSEQPYLTIAELEDLRVRLNESFARENKPHAGARRTPKAGTWWQFWKPRSR